MINMMYSIFYFAQINDVFAYVPLVGSGTGAFTCICAVIGDINPLS